jgi:hypothetical protein
MFRLRKKVLLRDPELAALHRAVVIKGKLSETDFWSTRQVWCQSIFPTSKNQLNHPFGIAFD